MNRSVLFSFLLFLILISCTPTVSEKGKSIQERIISEMSVEQPQENLPEEKIQEQADLPSKHTVRIGILDDELRIMFSFTGLYSVHSQDKRIFKKKKSAGTWKIYPENEKIVAENIESGESITVVGDLIFKPEQISSYLTLSKIASGKQWVWPDSKSRSYKGSIEFININGKITVVNEVGIEQYVYGVVPSEMPSGAPVEALKAQAVLARTNVFSKIGSKYKDKPYSLSSDIYSQVYTGIDHVNTRTDKAVDETRGMILTYGGKAVDAVFHSVCGGYLEGNDVIWGSKRLPYLNPKPSFSSNIRIYGDLSVEKNFRNWIDSRPESYCNMDNKNIPAGLEFVKKYYRWEVKIPRSRLEKTIRSSTGVDVGSIKDISIVSRGESGKAKSVLISGSKNNVTITRELNIRKKLASPPLYSANFYVVRSSADKNGYPEYFILKGAGFGHGTGMCQTGAVGMALTGKNYREILDFYFHGAEIKELGE
ncbi:MAG: SpoIID/LytB domain-containing protein [Candidatus Delongbacteria bacterium]|nr:SpoIID/LytB domain-containing protein [Candidatus Delongbacteria bacterium]